MNSSSGSGTTSGSGPKGRGRGGGGGGRGGRRGGRGGGGGGGRQQHNKGNTGSSGRGSSGASHHNNNNKAKNEKEGTKKTGSSSSATAVATTPAPSKPAPPPTAAATATTPTAPAPLPPPTSASTNNKNSTSNNSSDDNNKNNPPSSSAAAYRDKYQAAVETLQSTIQYLQVRDKARQTLQEESLTALRKEFVVQKKTLKTDLKKCTAFVKKLKTGTAWALSKENELIREMTALNLSRYVEEIITALVDARPKVPDLPLYVNLVQALYQRYADMTALATQIWQTHLLVGSTSSTSTTTTDVDMGETIKARRIFARVWTEFVARGIVTETKPWLRLLAHAAGAPSASSSSSSSNSNNQPPKTYNVTDPMLVVAVAKQTGMDVMGCTPTTVRQAMECFTQALPPPAAASTEQEACLALYEQGQGLVATLQPLLPNRALSDTTRQVLHTHVLGAYEALARSLVQTHQRLQKLEKRCAQDRLLSGTLPQAREQGLVEARKLKDNLLKATEALAEVLDQPVPILAADPTDEDEDGNGRPGIEVLTKGEGGESTADFGPFDDEETKIFYYDVPDFLSTMPPALLNLSAEAVKAQQDENAQKYGNLAVGQTMSTKEEDGDAVQLEPLTEKEMEEQEETETAIKEDEEENKDALGYKLRVLLEEELPECHNREQIDEISERFCSNHGSSKNSRKRLTKTLFLVPHARLDLLPFYSRMVATLDRVWSDIAPPLLTDLEQQFHGQAKFKKNQNLEARLRTARYLGELIKFRTAPPIVFVRCIRRCLDDFTGPNVDVACALLESCGRYLYRLSHTHTIVVSLMESMTRLSKAKNLDERLQSLLKAAFFNVKPPPSGPKKKAKEYPPLEAYLRYLLMVKLGSSEASVSEVSRELLRFPWSDPSQNCGALVCRIMLKACRRGRYKTIKAIASVAASLRSRIGANEAPVRLVDAVLEELRWALEHPNFRDQQRVLTYARLLGEIFAIGQISGQVVLDQLFDFIHLGHEIPEALREASKKLAESTDGDQLPVYNSSAPALAGTAIAEDEEMDMEKMEALDTAKQEVDETPVAVSTFSQYDPRVPSETDPPNAVYRIKLVCTLLEPSAKSLITRKSLPRVEAFLADFQRYLFTKPTIPVEVEFALLDTFDAVESQWRRVKSTKEEEKENQFPRYKSWLEAHNAAVAAEEAEATLEKKKRLHMEAVCDPSNTLADLENLEDEELYDGSQDGSQLDEEDDDADMFDSNSMQNEDHEGEEELSDDASEDDSQQGSEMDEDEGSQSDSLNEDDDADDDDEEEDVFDEEAYMRQLEEEAFERELRRATVEALEKGKNASRKIVADDMISGSQILKKKSTDRPNTQADTSSNPPGMFALSGQAGIGFQLLKRGNKGKVEAKELVVPTDTNLALVASRNDDAAAREKDEIKQRVLQYEAESAEAEMTGGNVYLEQEKLQVIRNKPLSMDDIDRNFGTTRGDLAATDRPRPPGTTGGSVSTGRGGRGRAGRGRGGRGRSSSGRTLFG